MTELPNRRQFLGTSTALLGTGLALSERSFTAESGASEAAFETETFRLALGKDGKATEFKDKRSGNDFLASPSPFAEIRSGGQVFASSSLRFENGSLNLGFADGRFRTTLRATSNKSFLVLEVVSVEGSEIDELTLANVVLSLKATDDEPFSACALALNLKTNVVELPRPSRQLRATCYKQFGFSGAKVALVGCPREDLRKSLQDAVSASPELPHSRLGGPWAMDAAINRGSYLFNFDGVTEKNVDSWIELAKTLGMRQIDFHGGHSFRFGDCHPHPDLYPKGVESLKAVIDRLHGAGIAAGLHTYAFFIAKTCPWVTPDADERLAYSSVFTLDRAITAGDTTLFVKEPTARVSTITGFFVRNSVTVRIGKELIVFSGASATEPNSFTGCQRGAYGTRAVEHAAGAKVYHLKECFGLFAPDGESTLLSEVAGKTADAFNACGFDMIYLDALDGSDVLDPHAGGRFAWHYGAKFAYEICQRLSRHALMEMSTFHHHLWCIRSRYCAWDHPNRSYKQFVDIHRRDNEESRRMFLPGELGWWALKNWTGAQVEPTYADDIEYLMTKCLATDTGFALMGIDPNSARNVPALPRLGSLIRRYEDLRHSGQVPESIRSRLREPGSEFTLSGDRDKGWTFSPIRYDAHRVEDAAGPSSTWTASNSFERQPLRLRITTLMGAGGYDAPDNVVLADFQSGNEFSKKMAHADVEGEFRVATDVVKAASSSGVLLTASHRSDAKSAWLSFEKTFNPPLDIQQRQALGVWVHGDGLGELLNIQLRSPEHLSGGIGEHYIPVDFTGWRYFELIEPEGARYAEYKWPYGNIYSIYRESVQYNSIATVSLWMNNLPAGKETRVHLSPIKALPLLEKRLVNPTVSVGGKTVSFPVEMQCGWYLEFNSSSDCKLYGTRGEFLQDVVPKGDVPIMEPGSNELVFSAESVSGARIRALVTVISQGTAIPKNGSL